MACKFTKKQIEKIESMIAEGGNPEEINLLKEQLNALTAQMEGMASSEDLEEAIELIEDNTETSTAYDEDSHSILTTFKDDTVVTTELPDYITAENAEAMTQASDNDDVEKVAATATGLTVTYGDGTSEDITFPVNPNSHTHDNKSLLNAFDYDGNGSVTWDGNDLKRQITDDLDVTSSVIGASATAVKKLAEQISTLGTYCGESATFAGLPTTDKNGNPVADGDLSHLTVDDGTNEAGTYVYSGTAWILKDTAFNIQDILATDAEAKAGVVTDKVISAKQANDIYTRFVARNYQSFDVAPTQIVSNNVFGAEATKITMNSTNMYLDNRQVTVSSEVLVQFAPKDFPNDSTFEIGLDIKGMLNDHLGGAIESMYGVQTVDTAIYSGDMPITGAYAYVKDTDLRLRVVDFGDLANGSNRDTSTLEELEFRISFTIPIDLNLGF